MDIGALRQVMKRFKQWRRLEDDVKMLTESGGEPVGRVLTNEEQERLFKTAEANPEWEHVYCAAILAANTSMRGVEVKHVRRKDFDADKRIVHIRTSKNETSKRVIPLNDSAFEAVQRMVKRADLLGHTDANHYVWCANQHHKLDPTQPASKWDTAWRALRYAASLPGLRFHDLRHTFASVGVAGHTSNELIRTSQHPSNHHLSIARAMAIYDALSQQASRFLEETGCEVLEIRGEMNPGFGGVHPEPIARYLGATAGAIAAGWLLGVNGYHRFASGVEIPNPESGRVVPDRDPSIQADNAHYQPQNVGSSTVTTRPLWVPGTFTRPTTASPAPVPGSSPCGRGVGHEPCHSNASEEEARARPSLGVNRPRGTVRRLAS